jgi:hypothetical protein
MRQTPLVLGTCALIWFIFLPLLGEALFSPAPGRILLDLGFLAFVGIFIVWGLVGVQSGSTPIDRQPGELEGDRWFLFYLPPGGGRYRGWLTVTNTRLLYDRSFQGWVFRRFGLLEGRLEINKGDIKNVEVEKKPLTRRCMITLADGSLHTFDSFSIVSTPHLSGDIDEIAAAIKGR